MRFFSRRSRPERPARSSTVAVEMPLLADRSAPDGTRVLEHLGAHWLDLPTVAAPSRKDGVTAIEIPGGLAAFVHVPRPYPAREIEGPTRLAWHWPNAEGEVGRHRSHVIASASSTSLSAVELRLALTKVVAAILATTNSIGVYIGDAMLVRSATDYRSDASAATRDALPLPSWVGIHPVSEPGGTSAYTTGLRWFGLRELEAHRSSMAPHEVLGALADIAHYELSTGRVVGDGDTFGATADDRTRIRYRRSDFIPDTEVAVVDLP